MTTFTTIWQQNNRLITSQNKQQI